jgi:hypothetical protein
MNSPFIWVVVVLFGIMAGGLAGPRWRAVLALAALSIFFLVASIALGWLHAISPTAVLTLEAGQGGQLVAVGYASAIASVVTAVRVAAGGNHAT